MHKYDVAVIGAGLGGLAAAALLSSKRKKTIVIEQGISLRDAWGTVEKDGFVFSVGPALSYGFEQGGTLQELSARLGIEQKVSVRSRCYQVALPDHRITVYADPAETLEELRREFRTEIDALQKFYQDINVTARRISKKYLARYLACRRSAAGVIRRYGFSREVMAFFDVQSRFFFQKPIEDISLSALTILCCTPPLHLDGGFKKFGDQLYRVILQHDGDVRYNETAPTISFNNNGSVNIETNQGMIEAETILFNALPHKHRSMLMIGLLEEVIPTGMFTDVLFLPEYSRADEFMAISLDADEDAVALEGTKAMMVSFASHQDMPHDRQAPIKQLNSLIPFLDDFMFFADEYVPGAGHAVLPADTALTAPRVKEGTPAFYRTSHKNAFVLSDTPETPLQAVATIQQHISRLN